MYCPQCATANSDDVRFCRSCGTPLAGVALALRTPSPIKKTSESNEEQSAQQWLEKRIKGISSISRGSILLGVSLVLGVAVGLFLPASFDAPWILIWAVFFGWMAVWGGIEMANGVGEILEAKSRLRLLRHSSNEPDELQQSSVVSVTEGTTRNLDH